MRNALNDFDRANFAAPLKFSFVAVMDENGYPHMNLISTLEGHGDQEMMFANNYAGKTKDLLVAKKDAGFLVLGLDMSLWTGKMRLHTVEVEGENKEYYNNKPSSRYNSYFIYHNVYLCKLLGIEGPEPLDVVGVMPHVQAVIPKMPGLMKGTGDGPVAGVAAEIVGRDKIGKFLAWQGEDGLPEIVPLFGAIPAGTERFAFSMGLSPKLAAIPDGAKVTLHCIQMTTMQSVQFRGIFHPAGEDVGVMDVEYTYNPMPPRAAIVWPRVPFATITEF